MGSFGSRLVALSLVALGFASNAAFAGCVANSVEIKNAGGVQRFSVEIADDEAERSQGLMFREKMASSAGMLFVYSNPKHAYFWMKDTLIPLDMLFADASGRITQVHSNAIPQDETPIDGGDAVSYVLEINGGLAARMGITAGSTLRSPVIEQSVAAWPCSGE